MPDFHTPIANSMSFSDFSIIIVEFLTLLVGTLGGSFSVLFLKLKEMGGKRVLTDIGILSTFNTIYRILR